MGKFTDFSRVCYSKDIYLSTFTFNHFKSFHFNKSKKCIKTTVAFEQIFVVTCFHHMHLLVSTFVIYNMVFLDKYKCCSFVSLFKYCDLCNNSTSHQFLLKQVPCTASMITNQSMLEVMSLVGLTQNKSTVEPKIVLSLTSV